MIEWNNVYATGNDAIDRQHQHLFNIFNDFESALNDKLGLVYLERSFELLETYAQAHFKFEERCMHEHHCPFADKNKTAHQMFLAKMEEFKKLFDSGERGDEFFKEILLFIEKWITNHIIGIDAHLKDCMNA